MCQFYLVAVTVSALRPRHVRSNVRAKTMPPQHDPPTDRYRSKPWDSFRTFCNYNLYCNICNYIVNVLYFNFDTLSVVKSFKLRQKGCTQHSLGFGSQLPKAWTQGAVDPWSHSCWSSCLMLFAVIHVECLKNVVKLIENLRAFDSTCSDRKQQTCNSGDSFVTHSTVNALSWLLSGELSLQLAPHPPLHCKDCWYCRETRL